METKRMTVYKAKPRRCLSPAHFDRKCMKTRRLRDMTDTASTLKTTDYERLRSMLHKNKIDRDVLNSSSEMKNRRLFPELEKKRRIRAFSSDRTYFMSPCNKNTLSPKEEKALEKTLNLISTVQKIHINIERIAKLRIKFSKQQKLQSPRLLQIAFKKLGVLPPNNPHGIRHDIFLHQQS